MSYHVVKLTNGETIIAEVVHEDETVTTVLEPLALIVHDGEDGRPVMVAHTWVPLLKKTNAVHLNTQHVVAMAECEREMELYYKRSLAQLKGDVEEFKKLMEDSHPDDKLHWNDDELLEEEFPEELQQELENFEPSANTVH